MTAGLPDRAADRERDEHFAREYLDHLEATTVNPMLLRAVREVRAALAARPAPDDGEAVDLTPGVVWTDAQLDVVRDLTARAFRAEAAVERVRELVRKAEWQEKHSIARQFGGAPFPVSISQDAIRRALDGD